jgi:hypothetical protein
VPGAVARGLALSLLLLAPALGAQSGSLTVTGDGHSARVLTAREGTVLPERAVALTGLRAVYQSDSNRFGGSVQLRASTGPRDLLYGDLSATYSFGTLIAEVGVGWRSGFELSTGLVHGEVHQFARVGGGWRAPIDATPLTFEGRIGLFRPFSSPDGPANALRGWEGETTLRIALGALPLDGVVGFRFERFRVNRTEQEVSMLRAGLLWRVGGGR